MKESRTRRLLQDQAYAAYRRLTYAAYRRLNSAIQTDDPGKREELLDEHATITGYVLKTLGQPQPSHLP